MARSIFLTGAGGFLEAGFWSASRGKGAGDRLIRGRADSAPSQVRYVRGDLLEPAGMRQP